MWSSYLRSASCIVLAVHLGACAEVEPAIDIELVVDPNVAPRDEVLAEVGHYRVVLDAPGGLYFPGDEEIRGSMRIEDFDSDPDDLEVVVEVDAPGERFPWIRIERGGLPDAPLDIRVIGYDVAGDAGVPVAEGILRGIRFGSGVASWQMSFDMLPSRLPPRVQDAVVGDGTGMGCGLPTVIVLFSKPVTRASLEATGAVVFDPGGAPSSLTLDETRRIAQIAAPSAVVSANGYAFTITLETSIVDDEGRALDQIPTVAGAQAYVRSAMATCQRTGGLLGGP